MALTVTDRGTTQRGPANDANTTLDSATTLAPADGSLIITLITAVVAGITASVTMSDTFADTGGSAWFTEAAKQNGTQSVWIFSRKIGTGAGSSKKVTMTRNGGTTAYDLTMSVVEVGNWAAAQPVNQNITNTSAASSLNLTLASSPASSSGLFSVCYSPTPANPLLPTGWTSLSTQNFDGAGYGQAYINGSGSQTSTWTNLSGGTNLGALIEITTSSTTALVPIIQSTVQPKRVTQAQQWNNLTPGTPPPVFQQWAGFPVARANPQIPKAGEVRLGAPQPSLVEQVPVPRLIQSSALPPPPILGNIYVSLTAGAAPTTTPVPVYLQSSMRTVPLVVQQAAAAWLPGNVETVPVPITVAGVAGLAYVNQSVLTTGLPPGTAPAVPTLAFFTQNAFRALPYNIQNQLTVSLLPGTPPVVVTQLPLWQVQHKEGGMSMTPINLIQWVD